MAYTIVNKFIPESKYKVKAPYTMNAETITIHNTANDATALNEIAYMTRNNNATSYHVAIDDVNAVQAIPFSRNAWHAGDGQGKGNRASIGIEICYSKSGGPRYAAAEANAIEYVAHVLKDKGWGISRVKWHRDWSGKNCPHRIFAEGRANSVRNRIVAKLAELNKEKVVASIPNQPTVQPSDNTITLEFSSGTLRKEVETFLGSKLQQDIAVKTGVEQGYSESWATNEDATPGDKLALLLGAAIKVLK